MIVDRLIGDIAVIIDESGDRFEVDINKLPKDIREGTVLHCSENGYSVDTKSENIRRTYLAEKTKSVFKTR